MAAVILWLPNLLKFSAVVVVNSVVVAAEAMRRHEQEMRTVK